MSIVDIQKKQNEERMLRYQYASRSYYNRAEILNDLVWALVITSWLSILLHDILNIGTFFIAIPFLLDIVATFFNCKMNIYVSYASSLRKHFDSYVLNINIEQFREPEVQELEELSIKVIKNFPEKSNVQMENTGRDNPRGVRNWYEFSKPLCEEDAIYECQRQNGWWNKKITRGRFVRTLLIMLVFIPIIAFFLIKTKTEFFVVIFSSAGLIVKCVERLVVNARYYMLSLKIDGAIDVLSNSRSKENIKYVQSIIDARRAMPVLERNYIHKRHAKEYSELYSDISSSVHKY